jgi:hypothetical protein
MPLWLIIVLAVLFVCLTLLGGKWMIRKGTEMERPRRDDAP